MTLSQVRAELSLFPFIVHLPRIRRISRAGAAVEFAMKNKFISPSQIEAEFRRLAEIIESLRPRTAMEIGTLRGGTLLALCRLSHPEATIISLDLPGGGFGGGYHWFQAAIFRYFPTPGQNLHLIRDDSHKQQSIDKITRILNGWQLDFLFIDGDHTYSGVKRDFEMYSPLVRPNGIVVFHDIAEHPQNTDCEVDRFWNEIKTSFRHEEIIADRKQGWAGIGVLHI
jgi:predicted O-methyltransferase YrrM